MKTKYTTACLFAVGTISASAVITATSDNFDTGIAGTWLSVGTVTPGILHDATSSFDGGLTGGDLLNDDGGLRLDTSNGTAGDEAMGLTIGGLMEEGRTITFSYGLYNDNSSFNSVTAQLFNLTDNTVLMTSAQHIIDGTASQPTPENIDDSLVYIALNSDEGDVLQIRFIENHNNTARDIFVDNFSVTSVPEPSTTALLGLGGLALILRRKK